MPGAEVVPRRICVDAARNTLEITLGDDADAGRDLIECRVTIDIGERGRLLGVEVEPPGSPASGSAVEPLYIAIEAGEGGLARTAEGMATATLLRGELVALSLPRRTAGYEITYPNGNQ
ncbi:MAG: hypothetical protein ACR2OO_09455 [Thermomicrobiales bacterium]